jgi:peptide/nickel transport system ATP-binding protein
MKNQTVLDVKNLQMEFNLRNRNVYAVNGVSFHISSGEIVGIVGESGCGKSVTCMTVMRLLSTPPSYIKGGTAMFEGTDTLKESPDSPFMRDIRGRKISMIFQEPMTSLNPVLTIGEQISESVRLHLKLNKEEAKKRVIELLKQVHIPDAEQRYNNYPHQFSGGMCQRIMIAMALSCNPELIIADEATTALDVTIQAQILDLMQEISRKQNVSVIIITHNLGVIARYADRIYVLYAGRVCETGNADQIFKNPQHAYTIGLLNAVPRLDDDRNRSLVPIEGMPPSLETKPDRCPFLSRCQQQIPKCSEPGLPAMRMAEEGHFTACLNCHLRRDPVIGKKIERNEPDNNILLSVRDVQMHFPIYKGIIRKKIGEVKAVEKVNLEIKKGMSLGLVGESGCGKTTIAKTILRLYRPTDGQIVFEGMDITHYTNHEMRKLRQDIQFVFQDPFGSLDPRQKIGDIIGESLRIHHMTKNSKEYDERIGNLMDMVDIPKEFIHRYPHELSGGQRQRVGIARALACNPKLLICDEPVSALDVSVQAQVLNLLEHLQHELNLSYIFIAHDLSVVRHISDEIAVMYLGHIVERGKCDEIYNNPVHPYTKSLLSAIPIPDPEIEKKRQRMVLNGDIPSVTEKLSGCCFHTRCPFAKPECSVKEPKTVWIDSKKQHEVSCLLVKDCN